MNQSYTPICCRLNKSTMYHVTSIFPIMLSLRYCLYEISNLAWCLGFKQVYLSGNICLIFIFSDSSFWTCSSSQELGSLIVKYKHMVLICLDLWTIHCESQHIPKPIILYWVINSMFHLFLTSIKNLSFLVSFWTPSKTYLG